MSWIEKKNGNFYVNSWNGSENHWEWINKLRLYKKVRLYQTIYILAAADDWSFSSCTIPLSIIFAGQGFENFFLIKFDGERWFDQKNMIYDGSYYWV